MATKKKTSKKVATKSVRSETTAKPAVDADTLAKMPRNAEGIPCRVERVTFKAADSGIEDRTVEKLVPIWGYDSDAGVE